MVTLNDSLVSSSARKLAIRKRPDLVARRQHYQGRSYWVVKDPVGMQYFRFQEEEFALLQMLDGATSLDEIKDRFEAEFPPQKITLEELQQFLGMLHRSGLVIADVAGQGPELQKRRGEKVRKQRLNAVSNVLCIRFKGFDPERVLNWLYPRVRWFFSPVTAAICLLLALAALTLVTVQFDVFRSKLPEFHQFFNMHNGVWLAVVLCVTKVCHEFGHGLACKHFGGECHEMGVMILVLTPCLYCNVSDSWMLPSKWRRAFIGLAGMYVEVLLASICTFLWWFSHPGLFNRICLDVMFVSSVTTILFNANPLLRYDGYYILSDIMEIPNLRQKATSIFGRKLGQWCLGLEMPDDPFLPQRNQILFMIYAVAAVVYRWIVALSICFFLYRLFQSYQLKIIGELLVLASLWGLLVMPLYQVGKFFYIPGRLDQVKKPRFYTSLGVVIALVLLALFAPLPQSVVCPFEIQARDATPVLVCVPGELVQVAVKQGEQVRAEQLLAELRNPDIDREIAKLEGSVRESEAKLASLRDQRRRDPRAVQEMAAVRDTIKAYQEQLQEKMTDRNRLHLTAPIAGMVLPPQEVERHDNSEERLPPWSGSPLDPKNLGAFLEAGVLFCQIGDPKRLEAVVIIDQADRNLVAAKQRVDLLLDSYPSNVIHGEIAEIAGAELKIAPKRLSTKAGGGLATKTDPDTGVERPMSTSYQANVPLDVPGGQIQIGLRGQARIYTAWTPLGTRLWRLIMHTFNFKL